MNIFRYLLLGTLGAWIAWVDLKDQRIPHLLLAPFAGATLIGYLFHLHLLPISLITAFIFSIFIIPISLLRSRSLGAGDSKLIIALAFLLGRGELMIDALSIATILGLIQIGFLSIRDRRIPRSIPFAPALIAGAIIAL